MIPLMINLFS